MNLASRTVTRIVIRGGIVRTIEGEASVEAGIKALKQNSIANGRGVLRSPTCRNYI